MAPRRVDDLGLSRFLDLWDSDILNYLRNRRSKRYTKVQKEILAAETFRFNPASVQELVEVESKLGVVLPPSYREFLTQTNGLRTLSESWFSPVTDLKRMKEAAPCVCSFYHDCDEENRDVEGGLWNMPDERYFVYGREQGEWDVRMEYLPECIVVSKNFAGGHDVSHKDEGYWLLNPAVIFETGEWEVWLQRSWDNTRYRSFFDGLDEECNSWIEELFLSYGD